MGPPAMLSARPAIGLAVPVGRNVTNGLSETSDCCAPAVARLVAIATTPNNGECENRSTVELRNGMARAQCRTAAKFRDHAKSVAINVLARASSARVPQRLSPGLDQDAPKFDSAQRRAYLDRTRRSGADRSARG